MTKFEDNISPYLSFVEGAAPGSPAATDFRLFFDSSDHILKWKNSAGTVFPVTTGGFANPMTTAEDIIYGGASGAPTRKAKGSDGTFLGVASGALGYAAVTDALLSTSDITTNNASTTKHGFAPKYPNDATKYLDGTGAYTVPAGGGGGGTSVLGALSYSSGSNGAWKTVTSSTLTDIDATNASLAITVPASGNFLVMIQCQAWITVAHSNTVLGVKTGSTTLARTMLAMSQADSQNGPPSSAAADNNLSAPQWFYITGQTPGAMTIKAAFAVNSGGGTMNIAANAGTAGNDSPFVMVALAA